jgi:hypothetical protein
MMDIENSEDEILPAPVPTYESSVQDVKLDATEPEPGNSPLPISLNGSLFSE